jgi:hypothetical protein
LNFFFFGKKKLKFNLGVKGLILNEYFQPISSTQVMIDNRRPVVSVTSSGEFWRILLPGSYTLKVKNIQKNIYIKIECFRSSIEVIKFIVNQY